MLDADVRDGKQGMESLRATLNGTKTHDTMLARSGSGGLHVFFEIGPNDVIPSRNGFRKDLDLKADNGYVVGAPSNHISGGLYRWENRVKPLPLPDYLRKQMVETALESLPVSEEDWVKQVYKGSPSRDKYLTRLAGSLCRSNVPARDVLSILIRQNQSNCVPPMSRAQVVKITKSVVKMERERRAKARQQAEEKPAAARVFSYVGFNAYMEEFGGKGAMWAIQGWLPEATCAFITAPPESFKTWLLYDMAVALSTGRPFLGKYAVHRQAPVILAVLEDSHTMMAERWGIIHQIGPVKQIGPKTWEVPMPPDEPPIFIHKDRRLRLNDHQAILELDLAIRETNAGTVMIDPLYPMLKIEDYGAGTAQAMEVFKKIRDVRGTSFVITHHMSKADAGGRARKKGWGSVFLDAWTETGMELIPSATIPGKVLVERHSKNDARPTLIDLQWNLNPDLYEVEVIEGRPIEATLAEKVREALETQHLQNYAELEAATGCKSRKQLMDVMRQVGAIKIEGRYILSEDYVPAKLLKREPIPEHEDQE